MYFKIRNYIAKMILEQAGRFSEPGVEFASFMEHSLGLRHAVIFSYLYVINSSGCIIESCLHFWEE